jgi:hypothetical protein
VAATFEAWRLDQAEDVRNPFGRSAETHPQRAMATAWHLPETKPTRSHLRVPDAIIAPSTPSLMNSRIHVSPEENVNPAFGAL